MASPVEHPLIIHLHIPKNAGTTLGRLLRLKHALWPPAHWLDHSAVLGYYHLLDKDGVPGWRRRVEAIRALPAPKQRRVRVLEAHAAFGVHELLPEACRRRAAYVTMLRDPIERTISTYSFLKSQGRIDAGESLEAFVRRERPYRMFHVDNAQVRYLAGEKGEIVDVETGGCTAEMLERAKRRIDERFLLVGLVERFDASLLLLGRAMLWRRCYYGRSNVTRKRADRAQIPPETIDLLRRTNELDLALYAHARAKLDAEIAALGGDFERVLARFESGNRRYGATLGRAYDLLPVVRRALQRLRLIRSAPSQSV